MPCFLRTLKAHKVSLLGKYRIKVSSSTGLLMVAKESRCFCCIDNFTILAQELPPPRFPRTCFHHVQRLPTSTVRRCSASPPSLAVRGTSHLKRHFDAASRLFYRGYFPPKYQLVFSFAHALTTLATALSAGVTHLPFLYSVQTCR